MKFDHIGIVAPDIAQGREHFSNIHNINKWTKEFYDEVNGVLVQFGINNDGLCFELVAPIDSNSPVHNVLSKKVNILNHFAYLVESIDICTYELLKNDFILLGRPNIAIAYDMKKIQYLYSKNFSYLLELIEAPNHKHKYSIIESNQYA